MRKHRVVETISAMNMMLLPPRPDACQLCGRAHEAHYPHDPTSLYWQTARSMKGEPAPTWKEAMEHCTEEMKAGWTTLLREHGVEIES